MKLKKKLDTQIFTTIATVNRNPLSYGFKGRFLLINILNCI